MNQQILAELKQKLEVKKAGLLKSLASIGEKAKGEETNYNATFPDYGDSASIEDNATEVADYTKNLSFERDLEKELRDVDKALKEISEGTYGKCKYCSKEIELERLKIRPESTSCVACKKALKGRA